MAVLEIAEQPIVQQLLVNSVKRNKLSHVYIFHGPVGSGRLQTALQLSQVLFCENPHQPCEMNCVSCRKIGNRNHPYVQIIEPEGSSLKIDQMREIKKNFSSRTTANSPRVYIFHNADKLTLQAANSLLQFLEEPQSQLLVIFITENQQALLPTIQSRAQSIKFKPLSRLKMKEILLSEGVPEHLLLPAISLASGLTKARALIAETWFAELRNVMLQLAKESIQHFAGASIAFQQKIMKTSLSEQIPILIDLFILWIKDMIHLRLQRKEQVVYIDQVEWMAQLATNRSLTYWMEMVGHAIEIQKRLRFHANNQLLIEKLLLKLQEG